jgi:hypothetical protein
MEMDGSADLPNGGLGTGGSGASGGSTGTAGSGGTPLPPEEENEDTFSAPVVSGRWIWTANPLSGRVALINAESLDVTTTEAGLLPTHLAAIPGASESESSAIVLNVGSGDATVLYAVDGEISSNNVAVHQGANRLTVSPRGRWALVWSDATLVENPDPTEGMQDVTVIDLSASPPAGRRLTVGYRPTRVTMRDDDRAAYVVSEPGVSVIDLPRDGRPNVVRDVTVASDPSEAASTRDVTVTQDGTLALVRRTDSTEVSVVSLEGEGTTVVTLPGAVTDLDLSPDGTLAFAVVRGQVVAQSLPGTGGTTGLGEAGSTGAGEAGAAGAGDAGGAGGEAGADPGTGGTGGTGGQGTTDSFVAILPIPGIIDEPDDVTLVQVPRVVGSVVVAPDGDVALLYTNAIADDRITILDYSGTPSLRTVDVQAPVKSVFAAPDGAHAVALLDQATGSIKPGGFSLVPLANNLPPKVVGADAKPQAVAVGENQALITVSGPNTLTGGTINAVFLARLPELSTEKVDLGSVPLSTALIPEVDVGIVAQSHPEGRITFVDLSSGAPRTLTGFELAAGVVGRD